MIESRLFRVYAFLAILLCSFLLFPKPLNRPFEIGEVFAKQFIVGQDQKISGVTGSLFSGNSTRSFHGKLLFQERDWESTNYGRPAGHVDGVGPRKWAVCTTIHSPTQAIVDFVDSEEWAIVVVGDKGMPPFHINGTHTFFLDVAEQEVLAQAFSQLSARLPWNHFGRKNMGYLFALLHGAEQIWDFDDDNFLKDNVWPVFPDGTQEGHFRVVSTKDIDGSTCIVFNPLSLMGGDNNPMPMWPRGLPLNLVRHPCNHSLSQTKNLSTVAILQSLADHEPDVDGIYRLTRSTPMEFDSDTKVKTLIMPHGILSPYNAQATLVSRPAFWSLLLPVSVHGRVSDIWRSYIGQRLLWDIGMNIAFVAPFVDQHRNAHNPLADMKAEEDIYFKSLELVRFLQTWQGLASSLPGRYEELIVALYEREYLEVNDVQLVQYWIQALHDVGYKFPALAPKSP